MQVCKREGCSCVREGCKVVREEAAAVGVAGNLRHTAQPVAHRDHLRDGGADDPARDPRGSTAGQHRPSDQVDTWGQRGSTGRQNVGAAGQHRSESGASTGRQREEGQ
eukprot:4559217-Prymnesium_polylepis.1